MEEGEGCVGRGACRRKGRGECVFGDVQMLHCINCCSARKGLISHCISRLIHDVQEWVE